MNTTYQIRCVDQRLTTSFNNAEDAAAYMQREDVVGSIPRIFPYRNGKADLTVDAVRPVYEAMGVWKTQ